MKLTRLALHGLKGFTGSVDITERNVLLVGPVGAGKTAVIQAFRVLAGMPIEIGSNLHRLSPINSWSAEMEVDGKSLRKSFSDKKNTFACQGVDAVSSRYEQVLASIGLPCSTPDLGSFLNLSGSDRARYFAALLGGKSFSMAEACKQATSVDPVAFASTVVGADADRCGIRNHKCLSQNGTPGELCEILRSALNDSIADERRVRSHFEQLHQEVLPQAEDLGVLRQQMEASAVRRGEIKAKLDSSQQILDARNALQDQIKTGEEDVASKKKRREESLEKIATLRTNRDRDALVLGELRAAMEALSADGKVINAQVEALLVEAKQLDEISAMASPAALLAARDLQTPSLAIAGPYAAEFGCSGQDMQKRLLVEVLRPWLAEVVAADEEKARVANEEAAVKRDEAGKVVVQRDELRARFAEMNKRVPPLDTAVASYAAEITEIERTIAQLDANIPAVDRSNIEAKRRLNEVVVTEDVEAMQAEQKSIAESDAVLKKNIADAEKVTKAAGQRERARADMLAASSLVTVLKALAERLQGWRDASMKQGMAALEAPFLAHLGKVFCRPVRFELQTAGSGRSTVFTFAISDDRDHMVPLEFLSRGQATMMGAAFLRAMLEITQAPAKVLTIETGDLDAPSLNKVLAALPSLGFDLVLLESNRFTGPAPEGWQVMKCPIGGAA